jgi:ankyrin repeat protein
LLDLAIIAGDSGEVQRLLAVGVSPVGVKGRESEHLFCQAGNSLHVASLFNEREIIRILVERYHVSPEVKDTGGYTPLFFMRGEQGEIDKTTELLLKLGASLETRGADGSTPLTGAIAGGNIASIKSLLAHGAKVVRMPDGRSPKEYIRSREDAAAIAEALGGAGHED